MNEDYLREMLRFAVRWEPYGGGSAEEIFVAFGLDEAEYFTRVDLELRRAPNLTLDDVTKRRVLAVCRTRLRRAGGPSATRIHR